MCEGGISFCLDNLWSALQMEQICAGAGFSGQHQRTSPGLQKELVAEKFQAEHACAGGWWEQCLTSHTPELFEAS